jgi:SPP1 family predicted phage head-tail adaptor
MKAGKLDRRVQIKVKTASRDAYGAEILTYSVLATVWAEVVPTSGREYFAAAQFIPEATLKIRMRFREDFDETALISYDGVDYNILYIAEIGRADGLEVLVKKPV